MGGISSPAVALGGKMHFQLFTANGVFTPSANLIAAGGIVNFWLGAGGGGGGGVHNLTAAAYLSGGGGAAGEILSGVASILVAKPVVIGLGGAGGVGATGSAGADGGDSTFNGLTARRGGGGNGSLQQGTNGLAFGGGAASQVVAAGNVTGGGGGAGNGGSGQSAFDVITGLIVSGNPGFPYTMGNYGLVASGGASSYSNGKIKAGNGGPGIYIPNYGYVGGGGGGGGGGHLAVRNTFGEFVGNGTAGGGCGGLIDGSSVGNAAANSSGGGGGAFAFGVSDQTGGNGAAGFLLITWFE